MNESIYFSSMKLLKINPGKDYYNEMAINNYNLFFIQKNITYTLSKPLGLITPTWSTNKKGKD